jgi:proteasome lid subunit RPN8/RPN11
MYAEYLESESEPASKLVLHMPRRVWRVIQGFVKGCDEEIAGFGYVKQLANGSLMVTEAFILEQTVTGASVDTDAEAIARHMTEMIEQGKDPSMMRLQWHSHVNMQAYFSGTDTAQIERYDCPYMISLVTNKRGEYKVRLDLFQPFRVQVPITMSFYEDIDDATQAWCDAEIAAKVKKRTFFQSSFPQYGGPLFTPSVEKRKTGGAQPKVNVKPQYKGGGKGVKH